MRVCLYYLLSATFRNPVQPIQPVIAFHNVHSLLVDCKSSFIMQSAAMRGSAMRAGATWPLLQPSPTLVPFLTRATPLRQQAKPMTHSTPAGFCSTTPLLTRSARAATSCAAQASDRDADLPARVGEDAAAFSFEQQSLKSWGVFFGLLTTVMGALYLVWIQPGAGLADDYLAAIKALSNDNPEATILIILFIFAVFHSGGAALRPYAEKVRHDSYMPIQHAASWLVSVIQCVFCAHKLVSFVFCRRRNHHTGMTRVWRAACTATIVPRANRACDACQAYGSSVALRTPINGYISTSPPVPHSMGHFA